jgi:TetR/AcrR family tetracycline transcriptional repressor
VRPPLDPALVVRVALKLLDEVGLDGLTLRRLAAELGVQAPALYWHFANKRELLDHMAQAIAEECVVELAPEEWDEALPAYARARRRGLLAHRDGARVASGNRPVAAMFPTVESAIERLVAAGFTPLQSMRSMVAIDTYVTGFVTEEQAEERRNREEGWTPEQDRAAYEALAADGRFPLMAAALRDGGDPNGPDTFEHGLAMLIDGMRAMLPSGRGSDRGAADPPR